MTKNLEHLHVGIDCGSVSINCAVLNKERQIIYDLPYERHLGKVEDRVSNLLTFLYQKFGKDNMKANQQNEEKNIISAPYHLLEITEKRLVKGFQFLMNSRL